MSKYGARIWFALFTVGISVALTLLFSSYEVASNAPFRRLEAKARSLLDHPKAETIRELDKILHDLELRNKSKQVYPTTTAARSIREEVDRMNWNPVPPAPQNEDVVVYVVGWNAIFVYFDAEQSTTRVVRCGT